MAIHRIHRIVAIGGSAGGLEAMRELLRGIQPDFPAPILFVLHLNPNSRSLLPEILARGTRVEVGQGHDGEILRAGRVYVAPPDHHMVVHDGWIRLARGPRENHNRPAIDPLFRSVARAAGPGAIGVVLSGTLDDGTAGLLAIKRAGGLAVVQQPEDALYPGMPGSAIANAPVDHVVPASRAGALLCELVKAGLAEAAVTGHGVVARAPMSDEEKIAELDVEAARETQGSGAPSPFVCPECGGTLFQVKDGEMNRYRCRVGHAFSQESLYAAEGEKLEEALWAAIRMLEEHANMSRRMAKSTRATGLRHAAERYDQAAEDDDQRAKVLRRFLTVEEPTADVAAGVQSGAGKRVDK